MKSKRMNPPKYARNAAGQGKRQGHTNNTKKMLTTFLSNFRNVYAPLKQSTTSNSHIKILTEQKMSFVVIENSNIMIFIDQMS